MRKIRYDSVFAIGHYCGTAMYMIRHGLRAMSGPLDWIGGDPNGFANHVNLICRDFAGFMPIDRLVPVPNRHGPDDDPVHDYYRDDATKMLIYHDFPAGVPPAESYAEVRARFDRRIARFYATVRAARHALLIYHTIWESLDAAAVAEAARRLREKLGAGVDLLVIEHVKDATEVEERELSPGVDYVRGPFFRPETHIVLGDRALGDRIYGRIRCRGRLRRRIRNWFKSRKVENGAGRPTGGAR